MVYQLKKSDADALRFDLTGELEKFRAALDAHAATENQPAPVADSLVEVIVREHGGEYTVIDDTPTAPAAAPQLSPEEEMQQLLRRVDALAEHQRAAIISLAGTGQSMVYTAKEFEVANWNRSGAPQTVDNANYPWAAARAQRKGVSTVEVLQEWAGKVKQWRDAALDIENVREKSKEAMRAASNVDEARQILNDIQWPT